MSVASAETVELCPHCKRWEIDEADLYCALCKGFLLPFEVQPTSVDLIAGLKVGEQVVFKNDAAHPIAVELKAEGAKTPGWLLFDGKPLPVPANGLANMKLALKEEALEQGPKPHTVRLRCVVDGEERRFRPLQVTARAQAAPKILTPELSFGDIADGETSERTLRVQNVGGTPCLIQKIEMEGSKQIRVREGFVLPHRLDPGEQVAVPVVWDTTLEESRGSGSTPRGFRLFFEGGDLGPQFVPASARHYRLAVELEPPRIEIPEGFQKHRFQREVVLRNSGTVGVCVTEIKPDQPWMQVVSRPDAFNLLPAGETDKDRAFEGKRKELPTLTGEHPFALVVEPSSLTEGLHRGKLEIVGGDGKKHGSMEVEIEVIKPEEYEDFVGIDFGTSNSTIAFRHPQTQELQLVEDDKLGLRSSPALIPSVLVFTHGIEAYAVGRPAKGLIAGAPDRTVRSIKRLLGNSRPHRFFDEEMAASEVAGLLLRRLVEIAEASIYRQTNTYYELRHAIVTVPANFYDRQSRGVLDACRAAGIELPDQVPREPIPSGDAPADHGESGKQVPAPTQDDEPLAFTLDEPAAAALYYIHSLETEGKDKRLMQKARRKNGMKVLVYDHGGGTLDISVAKFKAAKDAGPTRLTVQANEGDNNVGGDRIDLVVLGLLLGKAADEYQELDQRLLLDDYETLQDRRKQSQWSDAEFADVLRARLAWKDLSEEAKIAFSDRNETLASVTIPRRHLLFDMDGRIRALVEQDLVVELSRGEIIQAIDSMLKGIRERIVSALEAAKVKPKSIDYVFHTGRQSLLPEIYDNVARTLPEDFSPDHNLLSPDLLKTCVALGATLYGWIRTAPGGKERLVFSNQGRRLPHDYGLEVSSGLTELEFLPLLAKGTPYPAEAPLPRDRADVLPGGGRRFRIFRRGGVGEGARPMQIGEVKLPALKADDEWDARLVLDVNRKIEVQACGERYEIFQESVSDEREWLW